MVKALDLYYLTYELSRDPRFNSEREHTKTLILLFTLTQTRIKAFDLYKI